jgi:hypothetical protein
MDQAYFTWLLLIAGGVVVGLFIKPRTIGITGASLMAIAVAGLVVSGALGRETATWMFGIAAMGIPVVFVMIGIGSIVGAALRRHVKKEKI